MLEEQKLRRASCCVDLDVNVNVDVNARAVGRILLREANKTNAVVAIVVLIDFMSFDFECLGGRQLL